MEFALVETAIGTMGLAWTARGVARLALPDTDPAATGRRLAREAEPGRPDDALVARIVAYGEGRRVAFDDVPLDLDGQPEFHRRVYADILGLGWGETTTYGAIARRLGDIQLSRAVGQALGRNPIPLLVPCHRVLAANRGTGGFSAPGGVPAKLRMLALEGVAVGPPPSPQMAFAF